MRDKTFLRALTAAVLTGLAVTAAHAVYIVYAYPHSSVIQFIAREMWL